MERPLARKTICVLLVALFGSTARAEITAEQVRQAIQKGVTFLKRNQTASGSWGEVVQHPGGLTALCTLALLTAGVQPGDEHLDKALAYLNKKTPDEMRSTYAVALQTMVFCKADPRRYAAQITRNVRWLENTQVREDEHTAGAWGYGRGGASVDNSNSQFALLALYEAERAGATVDPRTLRLAKAYWENCQNEDGSWGYNPGHRSGTGSMTCAGIGSLVITSDMIGQLDAQVVGDRIICCGKAEGGVHGVQRGLQWLGSHFAITHNPNDPGGTWLLYYLYGVERVGRLTAQRFIGGRDWYREGAEHLVREQIGLTGSWRGTGLYEADERIATALALLFLSKGRLPVAVAKLKHTGDDWNRHRHDVHNLTRYVESRWRLDLTWQVVDLDKATVDDLVQSPVLYYCGRTDPLPRSAAATEALVKKLRGYLDRGGFLFAEAYCDGVGFDHGFRELMKRVFPEKEYRLRLLPAEHPIWRMEERIDPRLTKPLWGIDFGCRTSVVYCPPDASGGLPQSLSCLWELARPGRGIQYSPAVQAKINAGLSLGINVLAYATNRQLQSKEVAFDRRPEPSGPSGGGRRGRLRIANLRHPGGCHAAPRAVANLLDAAAAELGIRTSSEVDEIAITDEALFDYHLVFMHGRNAFRLTPAERQQLKTFIQRGGLVLANSICASPMFTQSFRREMELIFPDHPLELIPPDDPLLTPTYGGFDLSTVTRRDPQSGDEGPLEDVLRRVPPELEGIKLNGRYGVIFSRYDLSCALEKHDSPECQGYVRQDAARIGLNVVLYALQQ